MTGRPLTISRLAKLAGLGVETIRYYQRVGLIDEPPKPEVGYRVYPQTALARLHFILRGKELGFTLAEIRDLLDLQQADCRQASAIAQRKLATIHDKIADLQAIAASLEGMLAACQDNPRQAECPLIEVLSKPDPA